MYKGGTQRVQTPSILRQSNFFKIQTYKSDELRVIDFRQRKDRMMGKWETEDTSRAQQKKHRKKTAGRRHSIATPSPTTTTTAEERQWSGPAPEKTTLSKGHRGGKGTGRRPFSEVKTTRGEQQAQL